MKFLQALLLLIVPWAYVHAAQPKGFFDSVTTGSMTGWACDPDDYSAPLQIHFYASNVETNFCFIQPDGNRACFIHAAVANRGRSQAVANQCGGNASHGFTVPTRFDVKNGGGHKVYAWAINLGAGSNQALRSSTTGSWSQDFQYFFSGAPSGWDYSLTRRCIAGPAGSGTQNYYTDVSGCGPAGDLGPRWTLAMQSEHSLAQSCTGAPNSQSLPISAWGSGITQFGWSGSGANLSAHLKTDTHGTFHPCGGFTFNWFVIMDHRSHGGGPLPRADRAAVRITASYNDWVPDAAARYIVGCQGFWNGQAHDVEISMVLSNWGDNYPNDPELIDNLGQFIHLDGRALGFQVQKNALQTFNVHCGNIFRHLVARGFWTAPASWTNSVASAIFVGHELHNFSPTRAGIADLQVRSFQIEDAAP